MTRLEDIKGEERAKLERSYCRAYKKFYAEYLERNKVFPDASDLVKFRQHFMAKKKISTGV